MTSLIYQIHRLLALPAATVCWSWLADPWLTGGRILIYAVISLATGGMLGHLEGILPDPVVRSGFSAFLCRWFLRWGAALTVFSGLLSDWSESKSGHVLSMTADSFKEELTGPAGSRWQRETFKEAARRVALIDPAHAAEADAVIHGGLWLPVHNSQAAAAVAETYVKSTLDHWAANSRWRFRLWQDPNALSPRVPPAIPPDAGQIPGDPSATLLVKQSINAAVETIRNSLERQVAEYPGFSGFKRWIPAILLSLLSVASMLFTANHRLNTRFLRLNRLL